MYECDGQMSLFDFIEPQNTNCKVKPGEYVEVNLLGKELTFDEITNMVGEKIVLDKSNASYNFYLVVIVEKIVKYIPMFGTKEIRRLVYYDGTKQRGLINEHYFTDGSQRAYRLGEYDVQNME